MSQSERVTMKSATRKYILIAVIVVVGGVAVIAGLNRSDQQDDTQLPIDTGPVASIRITADGFEPATLSIAPGTTVTWINDDTAPHRVASNPHPEHTDLDGLDSQQIIEPQDDYSFTFEEPGSFGYHDHLNPTKNGTIIVKDQGDGFTD